MWVTGTGEDNNSNNTSRMYLASMYLDITAPVEDMFPRGWKELVTCCTSYRVPLIACMDTNAHSVLWGTESNARGEAHENYLFTHSLELENVGYCPTIVARGTQMCINVTISLNLTPLMIDGWEVSKVATMSDHRRIDFYLSLNIKLKKTDVSLGAIKWDEFTIALRGIKVIYPRFITKRWIDVFAAKLEADINKALCMVCPLHRGKCKVNRSVYWSKVVELVRQNIGHAWRSYYNNKSSHSWDTYIEQRHLFRKEVRKAKRESWKLFMEDTDDPKSALRLFKCMQTQLKASISVLSNTPSNDTMDSVQHLLDAHFPRSGLIVDEEERRTKVKYLGTYMEACRTIRFITIPRIKWVIECCSSNKAAGPDGIKPVVLKNLPDSFLQQL